MYGNEFSLPSRARLALDRWKMLAGRKKILVALSGGADSVALLLYLRDIAQKNGLSLAALHVNHMIRGAEADRDERFCAALCEKLGLPLFIERHDVPALAKLEGKGLEECARDLRYALIDRLCREHGFDAAALAHNADDNAETVIYNLTRGCALNGACGVPPVRGNIIRPLILCPKTLTVAYCEDMGESWVTDSTNADDAYTRNRLRLRVLPELRAINPAVCDSIASFCASARRDAEFLDRLATEYSSIASRAALAALDDAILSRVLLTKWKAVRSHGQLSAVQIGEIAAGIRSERTRFCLSLPGGVTFRIERDHVSFKRVSDKSEEAETPPEDSGLHGVYHLAGGALLLALSAEECEDEERQKYIKALKNIYKLFIHESVNSAKIIDKAYIRYRLPGDVIRRGGITRKIRVLFSDAHLEDAVRRSLPFICDGDGIIWIPGFGLRDGMRAGADSSETLELYYFAHENSDGDKPA